MKKQIATTKKKKIETKKVETHNNASVLKKVVKPVRAKKIATRLIAPVLRKSPVAIVAKKVVAKSTQSVNLPIKAVKRSASVKKLFIAPVQKEKIVPRKTVESYFEKDKLIIRESEVSIANESTSGRKIFFLVVAIVLFGGLFSSISYFKHQRNNATNSRANANTDVIGSVGILMDLPQDEAPTVATVTDKEKVNGQALFAKAENGDRALIYTRAKKAILYRPSINKIIEVMSLGVLESQEQQPAVEAPVAETSSAPVDNKETSAPTQNEVNVAVYNGSKTKGLAATVADKLIGVAGVTIVKKANAKGNFEKTIVIDLTGKNTEAVNSIVQSTNGTISELPAGEVAPKNVDILVIASDVPVKTESIQ